ncbi:MAG: MFS transporter [Chitinophagaceae bacterium]
MLQTSVQLYRNAYGGIPKPVWWLAVVMFVNRSGTMVIPFLTVYLTLRGHTLTEAGLVMAAFGAGAILGGFIGGKLTDRFGFFYIQVFSLLLNGVLFFVLSAMQSFVQIAACIFVLSSVGEAFRPANAAAIAAYSDEGNRTRCYSLNRLAINLGWAIGPAVGGILASINYSLLFWVDGVTCVIAAILLFIVLVPDKRKVLSVEQLKETGKNSAYRDKIFLKGMLFVFFTGFSFFQLFSIMPVYYKEQIHLSEVIIGWVLSLNGLLIALVEMVLVYKLENRRNSLTYIVWGAILMGLSFLILNVHHSLLIVLLSMIVITFAEMLLFPFLNNFWISRSTEFNRGQYAAVYTMAFAFAHVLAPTIASQVAVHYGFAILWIVDFILCIIAATGFFILLKQQKANE